MLRLRPYRSGDEDAFDLRADFAEERAANAWNWAKGPPGPTWTLIDGDGRVLGIGGGIQGEDRAWRVWAQLADLPRRAWPWAVDLADMAIEHLFAQRGALWIWAQCRAESPAALRLLRRLGFTLHHIERPEALGVDVACMLREG